MANTFEWPPLESSPEIFTEYMTKMGLPAQWGFSEVFGFDDELLGMVPQPVLAVIVTAEFTNKSSDREQGDLGVANNFYMKQTGKLDNACGVIACLHGIYNNLGSDKIVLTEGSILAQHYEVTKPKTPEERASMLEDNHGFQA